MKGLLLRLGLCLTVFGFCLYSYLDTQNQLTHLKIQIPEVEKKTRLIREENRRLAYEIDLFENPTNLIELAHRPEFSHLRHPLLREILTVPEAFAINDLP
ncbi:MAG TPA: hypothetical protein VLE89_07525 [Chlamydiales bacterium]|nr:hypothetical protein [Chlamydiales bacterium]